MIRKNHARIGNRRAPDNGQHSGKGAARSFENGSVEPIIGPLAGQVVGPTLGVSQKFGGIGA